ncbi:MAG TPA: caspase family protein [Gaiellaceae bacterium]|nr:caspase family protein [Gaiellaceae bacterium]
MANWALVIGIDRYWTERACLQGAVRDALWMREWLLDPAGGNVPETNLTLVLAPREGGAAPPDGVAAAPATYTGITTAIHQLIQRSGGSGDRLFFYYAGHGLTARIDQSDENAIVATDFTNIVTTNSMSLRSLWEYFETFQFADQFFFVDACRNIPWEGEFRVGQWPLPRDRDPGLPPVQQFILYATSPGLKAHEIREAGNERGAFTDGLVDGLAGKGKAKAWSMRAQAYEVRWDRLVRYVKERLEDEKRAVGDPLAQNVFQIPQETPKRGAAGRDPDPVLVQFPAGAFGEEQLDVVLEPEDVVKVAKVVVSNEVGRPVAERDQIPGLPVEFRLTPQTYLIRGIAPEYDEAYYDEPLELYAHCKVPLDFRPASARDAVAERALEKAAAPGEAHDETVGDGSPNGRALAAPPGPATPRIAETGDLVVEASDPLAPIEVTDVAGRVLEVATGTAELTGIPAGVYRARLRTPENEVVEDVVELLPGERRSVRLEAPEPPSDALKQVVETVGGRLNADGTASVQGDGRDLANVAAPSLSTVLSVAGAAALRADEAMRRVGFGSATDPAQAYFDCGLYLLVGLASSDLRRAREYLEVLGLRLWPFGEPAPQAWDHPVVVDQLDNAAELAKATNAGPHWLSLEPYGAKPLVLALTMLAGRLTMLAAELGDHQPRFFQYLPATGDGSSDPAHVRRLELLERLLRGGQLHTGLEVARSVLAQRGADPLAAALAGYVFLRAGCISEIGSEIEELVGGFDALADGHVLMGEHEAAAGRHDAAREAFARAVALGVPMFAEGLARVLDGIRAYELDHENVRLVEHVFARHLKGSIWSAWTPDDFRPGELLIP